MLNKVLSTTLGTRLSSCGLWSKNASNNRNSIPFPLSPQGSLCKLTALFALMLGGCNSTSTKDQTSIEESSQAAVVTAQKDKIDQKLSELKGELFKRHLLELFDELDLVNSKAYKSGRGLLPQELLSERLTEEVFPVLWEKIFEEKPDEVIVAEFTPPGEFDMGGDFGRGLRIILRKQVGDLNISTIMFFDYNEKTQQLEFPRDFFFKEEGYLIPDSMRMLIEYDVPASTRFLSEISQDSLGNFSELKFFGTTISAKIDPKTASVIDIKIHPTKDAYDEAPIGKNDKPIGGIVSFWGCTGCHSRERGFPGRLTSFEEKQVNIHLNQDEVIHDFINYVRANKLFASADEREKALSDLQTKLRSPKENLTDLLPVGFLDTLKRKQNELKAKSTVLERYRSVGALSEN